MTFPRGHAPALMSRMYEEDEEDQAERISARQQGSLDEQVHLEIDFGCNGLCLDVGRDGPWTCYHIMT